MYDPVKNTRRFSDIYEESKNIAEKKIKEKQIKLEEYELTAIKGDDEIDLSIDEFEEEDAQVPLKFEKRKAGKADLEDSEEFAHLLAKYELLHNAPKAPEDLIKMIDAVTVSDVKRVADDLFKV